jgi:hypothetical protein
MAEWQTSVYCRGIVHEITWASEGDFRAGEAFLDELAGPGAPDEEGVRYYFCKTEDQLDAFYDFRALLRERSARNDGLSPEDGAQWREAHFRFVPRPCGPAIPSPGPWSEAERNPGSSATKPPRSGTLRFSACRCARSPGCRPSPSAPSATC